jgi:hypothetical protein
MRFVLALAAAALLAGSVQAQAPAAKAKPAMTTTTTTNTSTSTAKSTTRKPRTPQSLDCSKQADAKGLHGADRKKFRASCMKAAK